MRSLNHVLSILLLPLAAFLMTNCSPRESTAHESLPEVVTYKSPTCGCCSKWVAHMEENGFEVSTTDMPDVRPIKEQFGLPGELASCHTAIVGGYVVEGHVPADVVKTMLEEKPEIVGISVPGMPIGSPGMEVPGREADSYDIVAFKKDGSQYTFASR